MRSGRKSAGGSRASARSRATARTVLAERPATWVKFRPGLCEGCWAGCCTLPVTVTSEDLFHMGYLTAVQVNGPLLRIAARLMREGLVKSYNNRTRIFTLQTKNGH